MSENPYAAPQNLEPAPADALSDAHAVRKAHLGTEASIKSIGIIYYLGALGLFVSFFFLPSSVSSDGGVGDLGKAAGIGIVSLVPAALLIVVAAALRRLKPWAKFPVAIFSTLGLVGFPIGTLINLYILYLVFSRKGRMVLSTPYQEIIAATPEMKYKTSRVLIWVGVGILLIIGVGTVVSLMAS